MNTPYLFLILAFLPLVLAAPRVSPREDGCPIGATSVTSVTYTVMAPVQTIMIDRAQGDGCSWLKDASQPVLVPPMPSSGASNRFWIPGFPAPSDISPDGTNRGPSAAASSIGDVPGGSRGDRGPDQPSAIGPGAAVPTGGSGPTRTLENGNFGQGLPTDESRTAANSNANNPATTLRTQTNPPPSSTGDPPPRFVIFAGSSSKTFNVSRIHQGPFCVVMLGFWVLFNLIV
ncbi:hypothetical protein CPLU01_07804 [Colletotrichum plurivorum]|uniref:Uncharacterized protein n=1 Tax=Colletotrichum plurivorum TaxID=2175906 RepID=A0A8H6KDN6_9PEZI|nr:hypothetical protein CPLU01_07804 [Colletotrichum plurivorum]